MQMHLLHYANAISRHLLKMQTLSIFPPSECESAMPKGSPLFPKAGRILASPWEVWKTLVLGSIPESLILLDWAVAWAAGVH